MRAPSARDARLHAWTFAVMAALSAVGMIGAAAAAMPVAVNVAAAIFAGSAVLAALRTAREPPGRPRPELGPGLEVWRRLRLETRLAVIAYAWGAVAMQGVYLTLLTGLRWQHAWQYALAMTLLALLSLAYFRALWPPPAAAAGVAVPGASAARLRWGLPLAATQALVAAAGLAWLWGSGKLASARADWAANRVFVALAIAILAIAVSSLASQVRSRRAT